MLVERLVQVGAGPFVELFVADTGGAPERTLLARAMLLHNTLLAGEGPGGAVTPDCAGNITA